MFLKEAAPHGLLGTEDRAVFTERYLARLDAIGIDAFLRRFRSISVEHEGRGLVLLCFEPVGQFCHRRLLASWLEEQTGQPVPELPAEQLGLF